MKATVVRLASIDRYGEYFPDGSEEVTVDLVIQRGTPEWDALFDAYRDRRPIQLVLKADSIELPKLKKVR